MFYKILQTFIPVRKHPAIRIAAFFVVGYISNVIVYLNDLVNILAALCGFIAYVVVFHQGKVVEKITTILTFYPIMVAVNFLMMDGSGQLFFLVIHAPGSPDAGWTEGMWLADAAFYALANLARLLFWIGVGRFLKKPLQQIRFNLTTKMWFIVDSMIMISSIAVFTTVYSITGKPMLIYPLCIASVFSSLGCIYLVAYMSESAQKAYHTQKLEMQQKYYEDKLKEEERVRAIYHDMKNHLLVMEQAGGVGEAGQIAEQLRKSLSSYEDYVHTGNAILDIIVKEKTQQAREKQIDFSAMIDFEDAPFIETLDISTIFGNGMDNAIEACERLPQEQRVILVKAGKVHNFLSILMENTCLNENGSKPQRTSKKDEFLHGFGLSNIRRAVEKYNGQCTTHAEDGRFSLKILIPIQ